MKSLQAVLLPTVFLGVLIGQFFRWDVFPGSSSGILVLDLCLLVICFIGARLLLKSKPQPFLPAPSGWLLIWLGIVLVSFILNAPAHSFSASVIALGYFLRLLLFLAWGLIAYHLVADKPAIALRYLGYLTLGLLVLGAVIVTILPDFSVLVPLGWDPHQSRLTSTWLDPNFFGSFLALVFVFLLAFLPKYWATNRRLGYVVTGLMLLVWIGIYFTFSRSALATVFIGGLVVTILTSWRYVLAFLLLFGLTVMVPSRLQERFSQGVSFGIQSTHMGATADPTADARIESWKKALTITRQSPIYGVGYNFYQFAQSLVEPGDADDIATNRSAAGSDSSLLNILATTGILGLSAFLIFLGLLTATLWRNRRETFCLASLGVLLSWLVSSFLNNSLVYGPIMASAVVIIVLGWRAANQQEALRNEH